MTVKEYNKEFLPKITAAQYVALNLELALTMLKFQMKQKQKFVNILKFMPAGQKKQNRQFWMP